MPLMASQVAKKLGISWETTKKYLEVLHQGGYVSMKHERNRVYWKIK